MFRNHLCVLACVISIVIISAQATGRPLYPPTPVAILTEPSYPATPTTPTPPYDMTPTSPAVHTARALPDNHTTSDFSTNPTSAIPLTNNTSAPPANHTTPSAPATDTTWSPSNQTTHVPPANQTTHYSPSSYTTTVPPANRTAPYSPTNYTTATPANFTASPPTNSTTTALPTNHTTPANYTTAAPTTQGITTPLANQTATAVPSNLTTTDHPTTTAATTPAPQPTRSANLTAGDYSALKSGGGLCVRALMALQVRVEYSTVFKNESEGTFIVQPALVEATGGCDDTAAHLTLRFKEGFISFTFQKDVDLDHVYVSSVAFEVTYPFCHSDPRQITYSAKNESLHLFPAAFGHSYSCSEQTVFMGTGLLLDVTEQQIQALAFSNHNFGPADLCPANRPDHSVVIAVVTALVIILILVIIYFLRKRRRMQGYRPL